MGGDLTSIGVDGERIDYERITAIATRERPAHTLIAMAPKNDPFYIRGQRR
jgi:hypothetical protein